VTLSRLKHLAAIRPSSVDKKTVEGQIAVRLCNYTDVYYNDLITGGLQFMEASATPEQVRRFSLLAGDVLITKDSETPEEIGIPAFVPSTLEGVLCGYHLTIIRADATRVLPRYLYWCMDSRFVRAQAESRANGVTRFSLKSDDVGSLRIAVLPVSNQRAVSDYLDAEVSRIKELASKKLRVIELLHERTLSRIEEMAGAPVQAASLPLRRVARFIDYRGATPDKSTEGIPLITASHVRNGKIDPSTGPQFLSQSTYANWMRRGWPEVGDVVMTTEAPLGEVGQLGDAHVALAQRLILLKADKDRVLPTFLAYALRAPSFQALLRQHATGTTALGIKAERLRSLRVPIPSMSRQAEIVDDLVRSENSSRVLAAKLMAQQHLLAEHRQALVAEALSGQLAIPRG
jgi:type I restriction enzyme S subunit